MKCTLCNDYMIFSYTYKEGNKTIKVYKCSNCGWIHEEE